MTKTAWQYYFAHADLHFPADNHTWSPHEYFHTQDPFSSPFSQPHPAPPSQTAAPDGLLRQPKPLPEETGHFLGFFQTLFFQVGLLVSLGRCSERGSGGQPGREGSFVGVRRGAVVGRRKEKGCAGHISPQILERRSSKALDNKWIQLFTFVILH